MAITTIKGDIDVSGTSALTGVKIFNNLQTGSLDVCNNLYVNELTLLKMD